MHRVETIVTAGTRADPSVSTPPAAYSRAFLGGRLGEPGGEE